MALPFYLPAFDEARKKRWDRYSRKKAANN